MDPALDFSLAAMSPAGVKPPADPWLRRRMLGFGASEMGALFLALGLRDRATAPKYMADNADRLFGVKAGTRKPLKAGRAADAGTARERAVFDASREALSDRAYYDPVYATDVLPRWMLPLASATVRHLLATPDAWAVDWAGDPVDVQLKTTYKPLDGGLPWYWRAQIIAECMCTNAERGVCVVGELWANERVTDGPIRLFEVEPNEQERDEIAHACADGWARVEQIKKGMNQ